MSKETHVNVGDTVRKFVAEVGRRLNGVVIYVHPLRRFYTVRFDSKNGSFCECFTEQEYVK